jgi:hypothetical protein
LAAPKDNLLPNRRTTAARLRELGIKAWTSGARVHFLRYFEPLIADPERGQVPHCVEHITHVPVDALRTPLAASSTSWLPVILLVGPVHHPGNGRQYVTIAQSYGQHVLAINVRHAFASARREAIISPLSAPSTWEIRPTEALPWSSPPAAMHKKAHARCSAKAPKAAHSVL